MTPNGGADKNLDYIHDVAKIPAILNRTHSTQRLFYSFLIVPDDFNKFFYHEESKLPEGYVGNLGYLLLQIKKKEEKSSVV